VWKRNADLRIEVGAPAASTEKYALFMRYNAAQHDGTMAQDREAFERFLYDSAVPCIEACYFLGDQLVGVSLLDDAGPALSSVYMYFDPDASNRSLGTYSALWEIAHCRALGRAYYYLGYWVPGSATMGYKSRFGPAEILDLAGRWMPLDAVGLG
jgi:arginine-tRNA-protein transferase